MGKWVVYHGQGFKIPLIGGQYNMGKGDQNTMSKWVKTPWVSGSSYHGYGVKIPWIGGRYVT